MLLELGPGVAHEIGVADTVLLDCVVEPLCNEDVDGTVVEGDDTAEKLDETLVEVGLRLDDGELRLGDEELRLDDTELDL